MLHALRDCLTVEEAVQLGARAETLGEMFDLALTLGSQPLPRGRRVAILTNTGGLGILCADACESNGLSVPQLSPQTTQRLRDFLPPAASVGNPVDMIASATADDFRRAVEIILGAGETDALIILTIDVGLADIGTISHEVHQAVNTARAINGAGKPVLTCNMDSQAAAKPTSTGGEQLPNLIFPENAARVLSKLVHYAEWRARPEGMILDFDDIRPREARAICEQARRTHGTGWLSGEETRKVLSTFACHRAVFVRPRTTPLSSPRRLGFP